MSFLAGRLAGTEGAYFSQTSRNAISRLKEKLGPSPQSSTTPASPELLADVLPEILKHSPPAPSSPALPSHFSASPSSLAASLSSTSSTGQPKFVSAQSILAATNGPVGFFAHLPKTSFGPKRWKPDSDEVKLLPSTANEARMEYSPNIDPTRARAVMHGYFSGDIRTKGHQYMQPRVEAVRQQLKPWKDWAEQNSKTWHIDEHQYKTYGTNFAESLGLKQSLEESKEKQDT